MDFTIEFYVTQTGRCPIRDFLDSLKQSDPDDFAVVMAGLDKLKHRAYHRPPLSKAIGHGLYELRHLGKLNTRLLYFFLLGRRIVVVHSIRSKAQAIPARDRELALERMKDWQKRIGE